MDQVHTCAHCGAAPSGGASLSRCSGCRFMFYCSVACQKAAWGEHRFRCKNALELQYNGKRYKADERVFSPVPNLVVTIILQSNNMSECIKQYMDTCNSTDARVVLSTAVLQALEVDMLGCSLSAKGETNGFSTINDVSPLSGFSLLRSVLDMVTEPWIDEARPRLLSCFKLVVKATPVSELNRHWITEIVKAESISTLEFACAYAHPSMQREVVSILLAHGCDPNVQDRQGRSAFVIAIHRAPASVLQQLLDAGGDANVLDNYGGNLLHFLATTESPETKSKVRKLLQAGVQLETVNGLAGMTPLVAALAARAGGSLQAFDALVAEGADVRPLGRLLNRFDVAGRSVSSIIQQAVVRGDLGAVRRLLDHSIVPSGIIDVNHHSSQDISELTPLYLACSSDHDVIAKELIAAGADMGPVGDGPSALIWTIRACAYKCFKVLLKAGAMESVGATLEELIEVAECLETHYSNTPKERVFITGRSVNDMLRGVGKILAKLRVKLAQQRVSQEAE